VPSYVEWEQYPERKKIAEELMKTKEFSNPPGASSLCIYCHSILTSSEEFQFKPLPDTNPVLIGHRWKQYHEALGLTSIVDYSWEMVKKEKDDMLHVLDFPYNGETRAKNLLADGKITKNEHHL
jgi:sulfite oxidase